MTNISPIDALGDPTRRRLFEKLRSGPCSVNELVALGDVSQSAVSQHLKVLRNARLVRVEKKGQQRIYQLNPIGLSELRQYVESLWDDVMNAFADEAEKVSQLSGQDPDA
jgi:DNA-binding transcriptional ArsR family regulator